MKWDEVFRHVGPVSEPRIRDMNRRFTLREFQ